MSSRKEKAKGRNHRARREGTENGKIGRLEDWKIGRLEVWKFRKKNVVQPSGCYKAKGLIPELQSYPLVSTHDYDI